jgi:eukaryotic-like serine/threonine-protein kinase
MAVSPGTRLGPYEILAPLGAGGMGEVYSARDTRLDRSVAIKVLPGHLSGSPELRARFEREARTISSLNHPHICVLYDVGHEGGVDYLVMEHLEGETLAARLERGPLPPAEILRYGREITDALDKAHRSGIVHRDLKPGNIMITKSGAKLLDFGLARGTELSGAPADLSRSPTMSRPLTAEGSIVGTFQYMAPEQLEGKEADVRSDLFALGAVLYEMATGKKAFEGRSQASLIASILKEEPRALSEIAPMTPPGLDRLVRALLVKDPEERIQTAREVLLHLRWIQEGGSQVGIPVRVSVLRKRRERLAWGLAGGLLLGVLALTGMLMRGKPAPPQLLRFEISQPAQVSRMAAPRVSPNGRYVAFQGIDALGVTRIWVRPLDSMTAKPLEGTEGVFRPPFWSPDSRSLGFMAGGRLKRVDIAGGAPVTICEAPTGSDGSWSQAGFILYDGASADPIYRVAASGGTPTVAVPSDSSAGSAGVGWPEFLPDGKRFLYLNITQPSTLMLGSIDSQKRVPVGPCETRVLYAPPGFLLFSRGGTLMGQRFDLQKARLFGEPFPVAERVEGSPVGDADFSVSQNGILTHLLGQPLPDGTFTWIDRTGRKLGTVGTPGSLAVVALSPDEKRVATRIFDRDSRTRDIWTLDLARGLATRFTFDPGNENYPLWSPDGSRILYFWNSPKKPGFYIRNSSGAGNSEFFFDAGGQAVPTDWSKDGRYLAYENTTSAENRTDVWILPLEGERKPFAFLQDRFDENQGRFSPDGRWFAYVSNESGRPEVYVQTFPDHRGKWQVSTLGGGDPEWRGDGKELYYLSPDLKMMAVPLKTDGSFEVGNPVALFDTRVLLPETPLQHYAVTHDGQRFLVLSPVGEETPASTAVVVNWTAALSKSK